jgi:hypothetical protein
MACFLPLYCICTSIMRFKAGYVIENLADVRRRYRDIAEEDGPLLICANHLTIIDSAVMAWAFGSALWYLRYFHRFSWNLPAGDFFKKRFFYRFMGAISKCIFIHRDGSKQHKDSVVKITTNLVKAGEVVTVFPEGQRSRSGRFDLDKLTYGVGKVVTDMGEPCRVLCVYLRGDQQEGHTNYPAPGSRFHLDMQLLRLRPPSPGREGYQEVVSQIGRSIKDMEDRYFAQRSRDRRQAAP